MREVVIDELINYGRLARIPENRRMYYTPLAMYKKSGASVNMTQDRFNQIDRIVSNLKKRDEQAQVAMLYHISEGYSYATIARLVSKQFKIKISDRTAKQLAETGIALVEGTLYPL